MTARGFLLIAATLTAGADLRGQEPFPAWVGLYGSAPLGRLENENRLRETCTESAVMDSCYREQLAPSVVSTSLHSSPHGDSAVVGELLVVLVPGRGMTAYYRPAGSSGPHVMFTPDLFLQDWGYGVYFHQTIAERRGNWFRLPPGPWATAAWLKVPDGGATDLVLDVQAGDIVEMVGTGWMVLSSGPNHLMLRPEQPRDMWCAEGDPPAIKEVEPTRFPREELLDADGHLVIRPRYPKGC